MSIPIQTFGTSWNLYADGSMLTGPDTRTLFDTKFAQKLPDGTIVPMPADGYALCNLRWTSDTRVKCDSWIATIKKDAVNQGNDRIAQVYHHTAIDTAMASLQVDHEDGAGTFQQKVTTSTIQEFITFRSQTVGIFQPACPQTDTPWKLGTYNPRRGGSLLELQNRPRIMTPLETVFSVTDEGNAVANGMLFKPVAAAPTAAQIGAGGVWVGNVNGELVKVTSDGITTLTKKL